MNETDFYDKYDDAVSSTDEHDYTVSYVELVWGRGWG